MTRQPVTTLQLEATRPQLTRLDWSVMADLDRLRLLTGPMIQALHHGGDDAAKQRRIRQLTRLSRLGVILRFHRQVGGAVGGSVPSIYTLDAAGLRLLHPELARPRHPWTPSHSYLAHHLAVSDLYVRLSGQAGDSQLTSFDAEPACWRHFRTPLGREEILKPDAHLVITGATEEHHWFVEVDRATESRPRLTAKCRLHAAYWHTGLEEQRHGVAPRVIWVVPTAERLEHVVDAIGRLDASDWPLFAVALDHEAVEVLTGLREGAAR